MTKRDYYEVLEVERSAGEAEIKSAYRKMAMKYHPDRNPGNKEAEDRFKECTEAYEVLKDAQKRQAYDQFGHAGVDQSAGFGGYGGGFQGFDISDALRAFMRDFGGSVFDDFFGAGGAANGRRRRNRGDDLRIKVKLSLEEIASGVKKTIKVRRLEGCEACGSSGVAAGSSRKTCPQCKGSGQVRSVTRTFLGTIQQVTPCGMCRGTGEIISDPCKVCQGEGVLRGETRVDINVPAGVASGNYMTIENKGNAAPNHGETGDLQVFFEETEHDQFTRHGDDIICEVPISFTTAALGGSVHVPTLDGSDEIKIPSGTQNGKVLRLRGKGIPHLHHSGRGDQLVRVIVWVPTKLSKEDKEILQRLDKSEAFEAPTGNKSFFAKMRETLGV